MAAVIGDDGGRCDGRCGGLHDGETMDGISCAAGSDDDANAVVATGDQLVAVSMRLVERSYFFRHLTIINIKF